MNQTLTPGAIETSGVIPALEGSGSADMCPPIVGGVAHATGSAEIDESVQAGQTLEAAVVAGSGVVPAVVFDFRFLPPVDAIVPPFHVRTRGVQLALARYLPNGNRGRNVFLLNDDSLTENEPADPSTVKRIFYGGSNNVVSAEERDLLEAAGYSVTWVGA